MQRHLNNLCLYSRDIELLSATSRMGPITVAVSLILTGLQPGNLKSAIESVREIWKKMKILQAHDQCAEAEDYLDFKHGYHV